MLTDEAPWDLAGGIVFSTIDGFGLPSKAQLAFALRVFRLLTHHNLMQKMARKKANIDKATIMPIITADSFPLFDEAPDPLLGDEIPVEWGTGAVKEAEGFPVVKLFELGP